MNCYFHNDVAGVANCPNCSSAICRSCADASPIALDNKRLCFRCAKDVLEKQLKTLRRKHLWAKIIVPINALLIFLLISGFYYSSDAIILYWLIGGLTGLPAAMSSFFSSEEHTADGVVIRIKKDEGILEGCLFPLFFSLLFAPVFVLVSLVKNSIILYNGKSDRQILKKQLYEVEEFLAKV